jgi:hypothetical protein
MGTSRSSVLKKASYMVLACRVLLSFHLTGTQTNPARDSLSGPDSYGLEVSCQVCCRCLLSEVPGLGVAALQQEGGDSEGPDNPASQDHRTHQR